MKEYLSVLRRCALFEGIDDLPALIACLGGVLKRAAKRETLLTEGEPARYAGIVLSGSVEIVLDDVWGNRSLIAAIEPGQLFAEAFACAQVEALPVSVIAGQDSAVLLLDCTRMLAPCQSVCPCHTQLIANLMRVLAQKNLVLRQKLELLSQRTTRGKLMAYLLAQAKRAGSDCFRIPFDRQALADYLGVDRSAMSTELGKMRREGLIDFSRNEFRLRPANTF